MKILIIGGNGRVGLYLTKLLSYTHSITSTFLEHSMNSTSYDFEQLDITNRNNTFNLISKIKPDLVIHSAALANVDQCEIDHKLADSINIQGTKNVVDSCELNNCKVVYISTSYVFNGTKQIYTETDEHCPITYYGYTKYMGEKIILDSNLNYLILRIDQPYGWIEKWQKFNNVIRVLNILNSGQLLKDVVDWYNNPTLLTDIGDVTKILIEKNKNGIYNVVGPDFINRYEWALMIAEIFHKNKKQILPIKEEELNLPAKRGKVNLSNEKVFIDTGIKMRSVREGLEYMMQEQGNVI